MTAHINLPDSLCILPFILKLKMCFFIKEAHDRSKYGTLSNPSTLCHSAPSENEVALESHIVVHVNICISTHSLVFTYDTIHNMKSAGTRLQQNTIRDRPYHADRKLQSPNSLSGTPVHLCIITY